MSASACGLCCCLRLFYRTHVQTVCHGHAGGGAGKLAELIQVLYDKLDPVQFANVRQVVAARVAPESVERLVDGFDPATPIAHHAYAFWRRRPEGELREKQRWRCVEAMGFGSSGPLKPPESAGCRPDAPCATWPVPKNIPQKPAIVVISEGGMGFRDNEQCWEQEALKHCKHIVFKTANEPTASKVWKQLTKHADKLTVVISAFELRRTSARISAGFTWEETFRDLLRELAGKTEVDSKESKATEADAGRCGSLHELTNCRNLIVTFDNEAAVAVQMKEPGSLKDAKVTFVFRPSAIEEDSRHETSGTAFGFLTCFTAAIVRAIARGEETNLAPALGEGLSAMCDLLSEGHGLGTDAPKGFPVERIAQAILNPKQHFTEVTFGYSDLANNDWTFLGLAEPTATSKKKAAFQFARLVALHGPVAIADLPHLRIGDLITVDNDEVTALRNLRQVIRRYADKNEAGKKPLSIGVFGPPGSGKSFAVEQIARNLLGKRSEWLPFNLSQFEGPADLIGAFHQIRDYVLQGKLPVVFFDEFDSRKYLWLQYLLAPMQDGKFQERELTHTIGKCIFIFAGGTSWTFDTFGPPEPAGGQDDQDTSEFRLAKGPDFQSRLDAYFNVVGPNPRVRELTETLKAATVGSSKLTTYHVGGRTMVEDEQDIWWPIRRALMLRSTLKLKPDQKLKINEGLLNAILRVARYRHGSRSMEKILSPLMAAKTFQPSFVPHRSQLELHTDAGDFLYWLNSSTDRDKVKLEKISSTEIGVIASGVHDTWNQIMLRAGNMESKDIENLDARKDKWSKREQTLDQEQSNIENSTCDDKVKEREFARIKAERKKIPAELTKIESNTGAAERMPTILAVVNLHLKQAASQGSNDDQLLVRRRIAFHQELLASEEHREWMDWYHERGWTFDPKRDDFQQKHDCLKPFSELPEHQKDKDRMAVCNYPEFAKSASYRIEMFEP